MALSYSWRQLGQRIWRSFNNDFPSAQFSVSENEMQLFINEAMSTGIIGQVYGGAKVLGTMEVPEAYILQFQLAALTQDAVSGYWTTTLPQPPLSLPLGYSINRMYFADNSHGQGMEVIMIKAKRVARRLTMPMQFGVRFWVTGNRIWLAASNNTSLLGETLFVEMPSTRAVNYDDAINLPDDAQELIYSKVMARLKERISLPQDIIQDDLTQGNKSS